MEERAKRPSTFEWQVIWRDQSQMRNDDNIFISFEIRKTKNYRKRKIWDWMSRLYVIYIEFGWLAQSEAHLFCVCVCVWCGERSLAHTTLYYLFSFYFFLLLFPVTWVWIRKIYLKHFFSVPIFLSFSIYLRYFFFFALLFFWFMKSNRKKGEVKMYLAFCGCF